MHRNIISYLFIICYLSLHAKIIPQNNPHLNESIQLINEFIASENFSKKSGNKSELQLIDSIYSYALTVNNHNISETLLSLTFGVLPFQKMPIQISSFAFDIPLPSVNDSLFEKKLLNLPRHFLFDSPKNSHGDQDKLAHFFGNAFLSYNIRFFNLSKFMGIFVELFEESFKVHGGLDRRDLLINQFGELFGDILNDHPDTKPSDIIKLYSISYIRYIN
ncbi:MAG: hypothetical protein K9J16_01485 [Melioribacteraceae bacterium]|nr:hypothetical protein [Melioribacteraceae bacterium]MCF8352816.1 hypothetical protein [Melioribacteraceae bacterium]MCF8393464.1 hypothetical protein [Melioribacteraceae bacterium]MCF8417333.1 hypothetical protein [Melioribacteraceae bacterium]